MLLKSDAALIMISKLYPKATCMHGYHNLEVNNLLVKMVGHVVQLICKLLFTKVPAILSLISASIKHCKTLEVKSTSEKEWNKSPD